MQAEMLRRVLMRATKLGHASDMLIIGAQPAINSVFASSRPGDVLMGPGPGEQSFCGVPVIIAPDLSDEAIKVARVVFDSASLKGGDDA